MRKNFITDRDVKHWNGLPRGSGGVTIPGTVQKTCGYGTSGHGLAGKVVLG